MLCFMDTKFESRIDFVVRSLREAMPRRWPEISRESGVPESTIRKIAYRETRDPRASTLDDLHRYFTRFATKPTRRTKKQKQETIS